MLDPWQRDVQQRLASAQEHKKNGGMHFQQQEYKNAGECYIKALRDLIPVINSTPEEREAADTLITACYSNLAACQLKLHQHHRVISNCTKALSFDSSNVKCLYRRAAAHLECKNPDNAEDDIRAVLEIEPGNTAAKDLKMRLKKMRNEKDKTDAKVMKAYMQEK